MKLGIKALAAAITMAVASTGAHASIDSGAYGNYGELFLTVWDPTSGNEASFSVGLDVNVNTFNSSGSYTYENIFSNPAFVTAFGPSSTGGSNLTNQSAWRWNITGSKALGEEARIITTSVINTQADLINGAVDNAASSIEAFRLQVGAGDAYSTDNKNALGYAGENYGSNLNGLQALTGNAGTIGQALYMYTFDDNTAPDYIETSQTPADKTLAQYTWLLDANGKLTYNAEAAPVPVPAAVWLLGSGLVSLAGVARRRRQGVAVAA